LYEKNQVGQYLRMGIVQDLLIIRRSHRLKHNK
jgi:hypothetical protein